MNGDLRIGTWLVQPSLNTISRDGTRRQLEPKVMEVLVCLAHHPGEISSKEQLLKTVWPDTFVSDDVLVRSIYEIRRAFEDDARESKFIQTIPKRGYRLIVPVEPVNGTAPFVTAASGLNGTERQLIFRKRRLRIGIVIGFTVPVLLLTLVALTPADTLRKLTGRPEIPHIRSIAVLPLQNLSCDSSQEYFADAMTEELITELSRIRALKVISRTSVMRYKKLCGENHAGDRSLPEIARELGVEGIVGGSVLRSGDRVRITAQLTYAPRDTNLWAQTYDGDLRDVLALQGTVAGAIVREIKVELTPQEQSQFKNVRPLNRKALDAYLDGQRHLADSNSLAYTKTGWKQSDEELSKALASFQQAIQEDANYVPAYLGLSEALGSEWFSRGNDLGKAKAVAAKAIQLDDTLAKAHQRMAHLLILHDRDWVAAEKEFIRALEIEPGSAAAHDEYAEYLENVGRREQAQREYEWAQQLDPNQVHLPDFSRSPSERVDEAHRYMATHPVAPIDNWFLAKLSYEAGMYKQAVDNWTLVMDTYGWTEEAKRVRRAYSTTDPTHAAKQLSREIEGISKYHWLQPSVIIEFYTAFDDREHILAWVARGVAEHEWDTVFSLHAYASLRSDPRFQDVVRRAGLPPRP